MKNAKTQRRKGAKVVTTFRELMDHKAKHHAAAEALTQGGEFEITPADAIDVDWLHALMSEVTWLMERVRYTEAEFEPEEVALRRLFLARIAAVCEAWDVELVKQMEK